MYCSRLCCCCFPRNELFHDIVHQVTELHLSTTFVSVAVSEIRELNQNKKEKNDSICTFAGHITFLNQSTF